LCKFPDRLRGGFFRRLHGGPLADRRDRPHHLGSADQVEVDLLLLRAVSDLVGQVDAEEGAGRVQLEREAGGVVARPEESAGLCRLRGVLVHFAVRHNGVEVEWALLGVLAHPDAKLHLRERVANQHGVVQVQPDLRAVSCGHEEVGEGSACDFAVEVNGLSFFQIGPTPLHATLALVARQVAPLGLDAPQFAGAKFILGQQVQAAIVAQVVVFFRVLTITLHAPLLPHIWVDERHVEVSIFDIEAVRAQVVHWSLVVGSSGVIGVAARSRFLVQQC